jgi:hypothetical protein
MALLDSLCGLHRQTLNELCEQFAQITRFGMMRQLSALAEANLVITARQGPTSGHYLNPLPWSRPSTGASVSSPSDSVRR